MRSQQRIVAVGCSGADENRIHATPKPMHDRSGFLVGDPLGIPRVRGNFSVEAHRPFGVNPRPARSDELEKWGVECGGLFGVQSELHSDSL